MSIRRMAAPIALIALGVWLLHGCIYIPTFNKVEHGIDASKKVGDAKSRRPLQVNRATRADVERELGPPSLVNADGTAIAYTWQVLRGVWVMPLCFQVDANRATRRLVLRFDGRGILRSFDLDGRGADAGRMYPPGRPWAQGGPPPQPLPASPPASSSSPPPPPGPRYDTPLTP